MSIELAWSRIGSLSLRPVIATTVQEGGVGAVDLDVPRLGDKFAADITTTQLRQDAESRLLIADLTEGLSLGVKIALRLPNRARPMTACFVDGAVTGSMLPVRGAQPGTAFTRGDHFSIVHEDRHYLHMVTTEVIADADGKATMGIWPMLRFVTTDGDRAAFDQPMIEGRLTGFDPKGATFVRNRVDPLQLTITERR